MVGHETISVEKERQLDLLNRKQQKKLLVVSRRVKDLPTIVTPRDYVIETALDFGARFPGHRGADTNPIEVRRQPLFRDTLFRYKSSFLTKTGGVT